MNNSNFPELRQPDAAQHWEALHEAAAAVAVLAGREPEPAGEWISDFPSRISTLDGWRKELVESGVADLSAIMQPGLAALLCVNSRGQNASAPAEALWQEFYAGREALLRILPD